LKYTFLYQKQCVTLYFSESDFPKVFLKKTLIKIRRTINSQVQKTETPISAPRASCLETGGVTIPKINTLKAFSMTWIFLLKILKDQ